jgi:hypothetical protein
MPKGAPFSFPFLSFPVHFLSISFQRLLRLPSHTYANHIHPQLHVPVRQVGSLPQSGDAHWQEHSWRLLGDLDDCDRRESCSFSPLLSSSRLLPYADSPKLPTDFPRRWRLLWFCSRNHGRVRCSRRTPLLLCGQLKQHIEQVSFVSHTRSFPLKVLPRISFLPLSSLLRSLSVPAVSISVTLSYFVVLSCLRNAWRSEEAKELKQERSSHQLCRFRKSVAAKQRSVRDICRLHVSAVVA